MPSIFSKCPDEFVAEKALARDDYFRTHSFLPQPPRPPVPQVGGKVQVRFYKDLGCIQRREPPDLIGDFPLGPSGLDLKQIKNRWALESCLAVHPENWEHFGLANDDFMSLMTVITFTDWCWPRDRDEKPIDYLIFMEGEVSRRTQNIRRLRMTWWNIKHMNRFIIILTVQLIAAALRLPAIYDLVYTRPLLRLRHRMKKIEHSVEQQLTEKIPQAGEYAKPASYGGLIPMFGALFLAIVVPILIVLLLMGHVSLHLHLKQRAWSWMSQGTFFLPVCPGLLYP